MTTYNITMMNLTRKQVIEQILSVHSGMTFQVKQNTEKEEPKPKKRTFATRDDIMSLTGKEAQKGSNREEVLGILEKLEVTHGIGTVTRRMLTSAVINSGHKSQVIYQLCHDKFMTSRSVT